MTLSEDQFEPAFQLMKVMLNYTAILFAIIGMISGVTDWSLSNYILGGLNWEGPLVTVQLLAWFCTYIAFGTAIILVALAGIVRNPETPPARH